METVLKAIADWIKGILTAGIMSNLSGLFDDVNTQEPRSSSEISMLGQSQRTGTTGILGMRGIEPLCARTVLWMARESARLSPIGVPVLASTCSVVAHSVCFVSLEARALSAMLSRTRLDSMTYVTSFGSASMYSSSAMLRMRRSRLSVRAPMSSGMACADSWAFAGVFAFA